MHSTIFINDSFIVHTCYHDARAVSCIRTKRKHNRNGNNKKWCAWHARVQRDSTAQPDRSNLHTPGDAAYMRRPSVDILFSARKNTLYI